ncbi:MAG: hypothetical protein COW71_11085 [Ignavibacteriales bacterium CG18_big_fil_WC_8_21_14_2_50_31_20]|nr:MAG: hypothetical protein COW71_11085 [Ignavibacteriales bacterium CG18_big_fil_WC_8_21_14_2_50_31_20]
MKKEDVLNITNISKKDDIYTIRGTIDVNIVKCMISQNKVLKRKNPPKFIVRLYEKGNFKGKKLLLDMTNSKYVFDEIIDNREEYYLPIRVHGRMKIIKILK